MPLRVKGNKWNWEVVVVTFDGKLRGYLVSQTEGCKLHHTFRFAGGVSALAYSACHQTLYVAGLPRGKAKDPTSPLSAGVTAWRIVNDEPFYTLSVVCDQLDAQLANERFQLYIPFLTNKNLAFIVQMQLSTDGCRLACLHCSGEVSVWRLPLLRAERRWPLATQPQHNLRNPLLTTDNANKDPTLFYAADVNWWTPEEIILSRFSGAVSVCNIADMVNILGKQPEFFQGTPRITCAHEGTFMVLECESNVLPAKKSRSDESMEVVNIEADTEDSMLELTKELFKTVLYAITDIETFQPKPKRITVVSRVYRLLGVKSTTPTELFSRKIESGNYSEALTLAERFNLDSDLVYQQQWRKNPVSTEAIQKYLSKVSKKIWAVHQCVDRLPETLPAAKELLQFGLELTNEKIMNEINKEAEEPLTDPEEITPEHLNAYTSELLRCRHVMLFYKERLTLYESILRCEKSKYVKDEYDRLRSNSIVHSAIEIAKEGRIEALTCLWPHIKTTALQLTVLDMLPETINPIDYQHLLPTKQPWQWFETKSPIKVPPSKYEHDWCRKKIFKSIWSSNWSEDTAETEGIEAIAAIALEGAAAAAEEDGSGAGAVRSSAEAVAAWGGADVAAWYARRARALEARSGLVSHALALATLAALGGAVPGLERLLFHLLTLDTLLYDINLEGVTLDQLENLSALDTCKLLMKMSTPATFVADLKLFVIPFLKRYEQLMKRTDTCLHGLIDYLESISVDDLSSILLVLQSPSEFELDVRTHLELAERCLFAHTGTDQLDKACDLLDTILKETDGSISGSELVRRVKEVERLVSASSRLAWRGVRVAPRELRDVRADARHAHSLLTRMARHLSKEDEKPTQQDWEKLLKDLLELQSTIFNCITKEQCYEIYASALLTSGVASSIKLAGEVLMCEQGVRRSNQLVNYERSVELVSNAAKEYFNSASALDDPTLELARCCLSLIKDGNPEIQKEMDLISALHLLSSFNLTLLPIQVRLCEDRMILIDECLKLDPKAYMASAKLLKLAELLRIAGDDAKTREGSVVVRAGWAAVRAAPAGWAAAAALARQAAALRHGAGAELMARVAHDAPHAPAAERRALAEAAVAACAPADIEDLLRTRLNIELEMLQQMGVNMKENNHLADRAPSTDDEFADAVTTPVIEKKDLVAPPSDNKMPFFNYLLDKFQNKPSTNTDTKLVPAESKDRRVRCQEFYHSLYKEHEVSEEHYRYNRFSLPGGDAPSVGRAALNWFYVHNCLEDGADRDLEADVVRLCAEECVHVDTALCVCCVWCAVRGGGGGGGGRAAVAALVSRACSTAALCAALYAALLRCNAPELRDHVYLAPPVQLARTTLKQNNGSEEQLQIIRDCIDRLTSIGEVATIKNFGLNVNALLFSVDEDYRREIVYRLARSSDKEQVSLALSLGAKYALDVTDVWLQHAAAGLTRAPLALAPHPPHHAHAHDTHRRIREALWPELRGTDHNALINYFTLLRSVDDKPLMFGLSAAEHIKLLKKAKAASPELDYKFLLEQSSPEQFTRRLVETLRPENAGMVTKFLRTLPPAFKIPVSVNTLYTKWLTKYFFSVSPANATSKKWMQQYRQCASYFNKLSKEDLLQFVADTCFTDDAVQRVPAGTRNLMIMQAVDYCQQEQENDFKNTKNEQTWAHVGQELTRWARFLENFHSSTVQNIIDNSNIPRDEIWPEIEKSHGCPETLSRCVARVLLRGGGGGGGGGDGGGVAALRSLLQCLHAPHHLPTVLALAAEECRDLMEVQTLVSRLTQLHKEGVKVPEEVISAALARCAEHGVAPHKQMSLLALSERGRHPHAADALKVAQFSVHLFRAEWPGAAPLQQLDESQLLIDEGRREVFMQFLKISDTWQQKKALVDVLNCWPPTMISETRSLHGEFLHALLTDTTDHKGSLVLIKLLMRRPALVEEEVIWLVENVSGDAVVNALWIVLMSKIDHSNEQILKLVMKHKDTIGKLEIEDDLIKELLDNELFIKLVQTPLYASIISYIIEKESSSEPGPYTIKWATDKLLRANYLAEAGHLNLMSMGIPAPLRGFTQCTMYSKNVLNKK
ncbi:neuroblastoma-amplified sequence isoform X2 [Manduca sexta]|nr:neuroblastoma-amplified sequence isoform X2 [Manduca sexta]